MELTLSVLDPSSKPVSRLPYNTGVSADDWFLVARDVNEWGHEPVLDEQTLDDILLEEYGIGSDSPLLLEARVALRFLYDEGWKLRYPDLSCRLLNDISARFGFRSMAYREEWQYSLKNHTHPYTTVRVFPQLTYAQVSAMYSDKSACTGPHEISEYLGTVEVYQQNLDDTYTPVSTDIYMPHIEFPLYPDPDIGEVRFLARGQLPSAETSNPKLTSVYSANDMLYDSENMGYWVYPKGQTINCPASEFQAACEVYGATKNAADTSFTVPSIADFIKPYPGSDSSTALKKVNWQNGLVSHSDHKIDNTSFSTGSNKLYADATIPTTQNAGRDAVHSGSGKPPDGHKVALLSAEATIQDIKSQDTQTDYSRADLDRETYPNH